MSWRNVIEDQLTSWATTHDAAGRLPELVRRLLLATAPLRAIEMRAGQGTRLEGFDGRVNAEREGLYWPAGESVWELSVQAATISKLNADYDKRVRELKEKGMSRVPWTYVAVTARMSLKGEKKSTKTSTKRTPNASEPSALQSWSALKKADNFFRDVRVLEASDLAAWLSQAPAVEQWFLQTVLRQPAEDISDLRSMLDDFSRRTQPPLPFTILLSGQARERAAESLVSWITGKPSRVFVEAPSRDEAAHFVAAVLSAIPNELMRDTWQNRTLVVWSEKALLQMQPMAEKHDLLLIANFDDVPLDRLKPQVRVIIPVNPGRGERDVLRLQDVPWSIFADILKDIRFQEPEAERMARASGGSLAALQRSLGYSEMPRWVRDADMTHLAALVLLGAWQPEPGSSADRAIIQQLTGDANETELVCERLQRSPQRPMVKDTGRGAAVWNWASRADAWKLLVSKLSANVLRTFEDVACDVLGTDDPVFAVPREERLTAAARLSVPRASEALREGLAEGLARLGSADEDLHGLHGASKGSRIAAMVLRKVFERNGVDGSRTWVRWASLSRVLPHLAESSPEVFLDILMKQLVDGAGRLFAEEVMMGPSPHVGLLWAIEKLAWEPERLSDCAICLARLHEIDRQNKQTGRLANRPLESLAALFYPIWTQTNADPATCESVLRQVVRAVPSIAMDLVERIVGQTQGLLNKNVTPKILRGIERTDEQWQTRVDAEYKVRLESIARIAVELAGNDAAAWVRLLKVADRNTDHYFFASLEKNTDIVDTNQELWAHFRQRLHVLASIKKVSVEEEAERERLREFYERFTPPDIVEKYAWLFGSNVDLPEVFGWKESERAVAEQRQVALREIWDRVDERDALLTRLAQKITMPGFLGEALGRSAFAEEVETFLFSQSADDFVSALPWFLIARAGGDRNRLLTRIRALVEAGQSDLALKALFLETPNTALWEAIKAIGEAFSRRYWSELPRLWGKHDGVAIVFAIDALYEAGNINAAAEAFLLYAGEVDSGHLLTLYERFFQDENWRRALTAVRTSVGYWMGEALKRLDGDDSLPTDRVAALELKVALNFLDFVQVGHEKLHLRRLSDAFANHPAWFVDLLGHIYRAEGQLELPADAPDREQRAYRMKAAFGFLWDWHGFPGEGRDVVEANQILEKWARDVLREAQAAGYGRVAPGEVAKVLARGPLGLDAIWPCEAARRLLEEDLGNDLRNGLAMAKANARGTFSKEIGEGGVEEREFADNFRRNALIVAKEWPATARLLESLAQRYERDALREDGHAAADRREYGLDEVQPRAPRSSQSDIVQEETSATATNAPSKTLPDSPLTRLQLRHIGPAPTLDLELAPRLNLITGDNSLGKTFVLEILWWVLTGSWVGHPAKPESKRAKSGKVAKSKAAIVGKAGQHIIKGAYSAIHERWTTEDGGPLAPGLVIYARVDGGFSIWDPIRNVAPVAKGELDLSEGYHFSQEELWHRKMADDGTTVLSRGLLEDIVSWRFDPERHEAYTLLKTILERISPQNESLKLGEPERFHIRDARDIPTLLMPYGKVFVEHASAAVKRMLGFAYVLVWAVTELRRAAAVAELDPLQHVTFLIDEVEAHLHPKWQRVILAALLGLAKDIAPTASVQLVVTTHSPLVLVSIEKLVNEGEDALFDFDLETIENDTGKTSKASVVVECEPWELHGDVNGWLASDIFDETPLRSPEAEKAIEDASRLLDEPKPDKKRGKKALDALVDALGPKDPYLFRFRHLAEKKGWLS